MGMSATQARFLSLTARKSNVEFEGQQINQQRTTLSNESANYYSELCSMSVPTPPSIDDYTKVSYTFNDGAMTNTITSMIARGEGKYSISYMKQWQDDYSIVAAASSLLAKSGDKFSINGTVLRRLGTYSEGATELTQEEINNIEYIDRNGRELFKRNDGTFYYLDSNGNEVNSDAQESDLILYLMNNNANADADNIVEYFVNLGADGKYYKTEANTDEYLRTLSKEQIAQLMQEEKYYAQLLSQTTQKGNEWYVRYVKDSTTGAYKAYFYPGSEMANEQNKYGTTDFYNISCYSLGSSTQTEQVLNQEGTVEKDSSGRYVSITIGGETFTLTTSTVTDEDAYNDAMNQYNYAQHEYDKKIQDINSKLEIVQQQDKKLELNLKQLDTEENAIQTEMEAVKKVISKNVENSFKTFSA